MTAAYFSTRLKKIQTAAFRIMIPGCGSFFFLDPVQLQNQKRRIPISWDTPFSVA